MALGAVLLTSCGSNDAGQQPSPTTTSTTLADLAATACREHVNSMDLESQRADVALGREDEDLVGEDPVGVTNHITVALQDLRPAAGSSQFALGDA